MHSKPQASPLSPKLRVMLHVLLSITVLNYVAQIPYYIHFYGVHQVAPTPFAVLFLLVTFVLFLAGYLLLLQAKPAGGWLLLLFLLLEFGGNVDTNPTPQHSRPPGMGGSKVEAILPDGLRHFSKKPLIFDFTTCVAEELILQ